MARFTTFMFIFLMGVTIAYPFIEFMFLSFGAKQDVPDATTRTSCSRESSQTSNKVGRVILSTVFYGLIFIGIPVALSTIGFPLFMGTRDHVPAVPHLAAVPPRRRGALLRPQPQLLQHLRAGQVHVCHLRRPQKG